MCVFFAEETPHGQVGVDGNNSMPTLEDAESQRAALSFIKAAMREPLLAKEEEFALARRWREQQDETALHKLTRAYTKLVVSTAVRYRHYGLSLVDLIQEGSVGLMQAAGRFETERDVRFSTYASWWIRSAMQDYILRNWSIVRTGTTAAQKSLFFNLRRLRAKIAREAGGAELGHEARVKIAAELQVSVQDVTEMEKRLSGPDQSLNAPLAEDSDGEWQDLLPDDRANPEQVVIGLRDAETRSRWLNEALATLSPRERTIIRERRLSDESTTLEELGRELGVSKERVRQLEQRALDKLKAAILTKTDKVGDLLIEA
jgi:RNA polymerase sigma-32 factor